MTDNRIIPLNQIQNFRDYGGYQGADGRRVRHGILWRSAEHGDATDDDLARVDRLNLGVVFDLRGNSERANKPCRRGRDFSAQVYYHDGETAGLALHTEAAQGAISAADARQAMRDLYAKIAWRENLLPMVRRYLSVVATHDGASLIHCVAGKDRTGFAVAMLHHLLGVHRDDIMTDYLLTNTAGNIERRLAAAQERPSGKYGLLDDDAMRALMGVDEEYLAASIAAIEARHGTLDVYAEEVLGQDSASREALRARLLEA